MKMTNSKGSEIFPRRFPGGKAGHGAVTFSFLPNLFSRFESASASEIRTGFPRPSRPPASGNKEEAKTAQNAAGVMLG